ncbi:MAG: metal ABC transporter substrate-binding protein [Solirubrobacterales bacterium]
MPSAQLPSVRPLAAALVLLAAAVAVTGCGGSGSDPGAETGQIEVVATTTQIGDWVSEVGGEAVSVHQILQPNTDPHEFEPKPSDVQAAASAQLVFANGDDLDHWIEQLVSDSGSDAEVVDLGAVVPVRLAGEGEHEHGDERDEEHGDERDEEHGDERDEEHGDEHDEEHGGDSALDPHWWHDPTNAAAAIEEIAAKLIAADPAAAERFEADAAGYLAELEAMDEEIAACIESVPSAQRKLVTDHDAFGYFANRYGIEVVGAVIPAQTTQGQPSAKDLGELAEEIEHEGVRAVFPESSVSSSVAAAIARQTGASAEYVLYGDTLGPAGSGAATYIEMEKANADAMVRGFTGDERGCG